MAAGRKQQVSSSVVALVALLVVASVATRADALTVCNADVSALQTCGSYCKNGSRETSPSGSCCSAARGADIKCLCGYRGYAAKYGYDVNRAMEIPSKCGFGPSNPCG